ncbi:MAG: GGDEF domain-containing protein [Alphaproteobacteria bacterium]|nr:GGDEF domain-containing protein [Alphaproteobacteria bacterium]
MKDIIRRVMHPRLSAFYDHWRAFMDGGAAGAGARSIMAHFAEFLDDMLVVDIDESYYTYRHYGRTFIEKFNIDLSNQVIEHVPFAILPAERRHILEFEYSHVQRTLRPIWRSYTAVFKGEEKTWHRLTLPVAPNVLVVGGYELDPSRFGRNDDGAERLLRTVIEAVPVFLDGAGDVGGLAVSLMDLTQSRMKEAELQYLATVDPLTGAFNRRRFIEAGGEEIERSSRYDYALSLLMMDIDHFKRINDTHGHAAGDEALRRFTATCRGFLRKNDLFGRFGGEEFALILPNTDTDGAIVLADRMRRQVEAMTVTVGGDVFGFTVSIGIASRAHGARETLENLLERADQAMYQAKTGGRNRVVVSEPTGQ